ncbi:Uncharacterised protein [Vibrio cholerae]|nr:Uncharacterised protein [Vibrio cholerae]
MVTASRQNTRPCSPEWYNGCRGEAERAASDSQPIEHFAVYSCDKLPLTSLRRSGAIAPISSSARYARFRPAAPRA